MQIGRQPIRHVMEESRQRQKGRLKVGRTAVLCCALFMMVCLTGGCQGNCGRRPGALTATGRHGSSAIDNETLRRSFALSTEAETQLIRAVIDFLDAAPTTQGAIEIVADYPSSWRIKPKSVIQFSEAVNVAPIRYIAVVNAGLRRPRCFVWQEQIRSDDRPLALNRLLAILDYEDRSGWRVTDDSWNTTEH